ncbi:MAG: sulfite exporter TauE/SafE family protein [Clostridia bacterium]|nr:sulfite exporter TauE/SafE family protein [Clostridia bacterium]
MAEKTKDRDGWRTRKTMYQYVLVLAGCALAGAVNGLLGTGGGILLVWLFTTVLKTDAKDAFAQSLLTVIPLSVVSGYVYLRSGSFAVAELLPYLVPAALGGVLGAYLTDRINPRILKIIFGVLVVYSGARMIFAKG